MVVILIFILILAVIIYLPINAGVSYYYLRKAGSEVGFTSLMMSQKVNLSALVAMVVFSVLSFLAMVFALSGSCSGARSHVCGDITTGLIALPVLIGMFSLFILSGLWFLGRKPAKIEPPSILN